MPNATPALVFVLMLIAPCAVALWGDRKKKAKRNAAAAPKQRAEVRVPVAREPVVNRRSDSVPVFAPPAAVASAARPPRPRSYTQGPDPYELAASLYAQPASSFVETYVEPLSERDEAEALLAQAAAAKAKAAALAEAARAAQAKAHAAAEVANQTARAAAIAHKAAQTERDIQAQITAQEQARTASGEHVLPETHPSLDFPRSGRPRRAA
jgi:hypothetical protein